MVVVRRINIADVFKLAILLVILTLSTNIQKIDANTEKAEPHSTESSPNSISHLAKGKIESNPNCPSNVECDKLGGLCLNCTFNKSCEYGKEVKVLCSVLNDINCLGESTFERTMTCQFCYQMDPSNYTCKLLANCNSVASPRTYYRTNCTVKSELLCLGNRVFQKNLPCNWTGGYKWSTALLLSITLGGFGADRFYLGHWQEAIGKLFSFGGLGVWTLVDVVLVWLHYLGPADGSLYI
ncbi:TM2 domain-containing protein almondex [Cloeon dipterum]|uniref:TM2 domain-containing protein almondex n=1 Tax=Cloeon dipterum TaxID=197152 RepID=UPI0032205FB8